MQFRKSLYILSLIWFISLSSSARAAQDGDFTYTESGGNATVTAYTGTVGDISIPEKLGGYPTVAIGDYAFSTNSTLTSVIIPSSVTTIGTEAFRLCTNVTSIVIPEGVTTIGYRAFARMYALTSVYIPASVTSIGDYGFYGGTKNTGITVHPDNLNYSSFDGVLYNKDKTALIQYPCGKAGAFTTPASVTSIGIAAFEICTVLTSVTLTGSVTSIAEAGFYSCTGLTSARFYGNAPTMGDYVFDNCASGFTVYYTTGKTGFTYPSWNGYPTSTCTDADNDTYAIEGGACGEIDCNDNNSAVHPGATEVCNGIDDNCNGLTDEGCTTWYQDADTDGYGNATVTTVLIGQPAGYVADSTDCDDTNASVHPGVTEVCNGTDDNCNGQTDEGVKTTYYSDADGDTYGNAAVTTQACSAPAGYVADSTDCDDTNASVHPGVTEVCNGIDDNCNGQTDEGVKTTYYSDADGDTYGNAAVTTQACSAPAGYVADSTDCEDTNSSVHPGATEVCNGIDDNCNGQTDEGVKTTYYRDADSDTYGNAAVTTQACSAPAGYVADSTDCEDTNASVHPGVTEVCNGIDDNCNGQTDEGVKTTYYRDADSDTYGNAAVTTQACSAPAGYVADSTDCEDTNASVHPGATEVCNGIDDDCNGVTDNGLTFKTYYRDADNDTYGSFDNATVACKAPEGYVDNSTGFDCNDNNSSVHPGATEVCNGIDDNCNGQTDEGCATWYQDADSDGYGNATVTTVVIGQPAGYVADSTDCEDTNASVHPGATEVCNGIDDNCNGQTDEGVKTTYYSDADGDTYGNAAVTTQACSAPAGYVADSTDCDDTNSSVHPGATEVCNGIDDNCNGQTDEGVKTTYYRDADSDTYGNAAVTTQACSAPAGYVADSTDCEDTNASVHPGVTEVCNGIDDNCNGQTDEGVKTTYYRDADGDTYGNAAVTTQACSAPAGYVADSTDCEDTNASVHPGATEVCNGIDDDCNGVTDNGLTFKTYYRDADNDTYGSFDNATVACKAPEGYVDNSTGFDCNDNNSSVHPGATEVCNGIDDNCNGQTDEGCATWYQDADSDGYGNATVTTVVIGQPAGYVADSTDCDDTNASVHPGATEVCNGIDDNCNGQTDEGVKTTYYSDADGDTYGNAAVTTQACSAPAGYVADSTDCDDTNSSVHPGATEVCNGIDDNCNGQTDEGVKTTYYRDADSDTYGNAAVTTQACSAPAGYVADSTDCEDTNASVHPGVTEVCNGIDDNCNGQTDEGVKTTYYRDADGDTYGNAAVTTQACSAPAGYVADSTDCEDTNASVHPGATEVCNGIDDDCNGVTDNGLTFKTYYRDADNDTYGSFDNATVACKAPEGYVDNSTGFDCNDNNSSVHPGATEVCNGIDDNCNGQTDEGCATWYQDADSDGYGNATVTTVVIGQPAGYVADSTDCDDTNASVHPGATEVCNGIDDNCNGLTDEGGVCVTTTTSILPTTSTSVSTTTTILPTTSTSVSTTTTSLPTTSTSVSTTTTSLPTTSTSVSTTTTSLPTTSTSVSTTTTSLPTTSTSVSTTTTSLPTTSTSVSTTSTSVSTTSTVESTTTTSVCVEHIYYQDADNDTYGNAAITTVACEAPEGYVDNSTGFDCNDNDSSINPGENEVCGDGIDNNCNGQTDENCPVPCAVHVVPRKIFKLFTFFNPLVPFVINAGRDSGVEFSRPISIDWGTDAVNDIIRVKIGKRIIIGVLLLRPLNLVSGEFDVTVTFGSESSICAGTITVQ